MTYATLFRSDFSSDSNFALIESLFKKFSKNDPDYTSFNTLDFTRKCSQWFDDIHCLENYTCPTDAHNLYAKGFEDIAHLLIVKPGDKREGWIEYIPEMI